MGRKYLPESESRIVLWRNTIQMFHEIKKSKFIGPFKAAGLSYKVEPLFLSSDQGDDLEPDIVASGESGWLVIELTTQPNSKKPKLDSYKSIDSRDLGQYGLTFHDGKPDVLTSRLSFVDDGPYCQIFVKDFLKVEREEYLTNQRLKNELVKAKELDLRRLPEIPITLLPEMKSQEIRRGLIEIIMKLFEPKSEGMTLVQLVDAGLERLFDKIRPASRSKLLSNVEREMDVLIKKDLSEYLEFKDGKYRANDKFKEHHKTMGAISSKLKDWAGPSPQKYIIDYA